MRKQYHTRMVGADKHVWDVHKLARLARNMHPQRIPLSSIAELDALWWFQDASDRPTPRSVAHHMMLVNAVDLSYPILLCAEGRLMDGMHRVLKALIRGQDSILAVRFSPTPESDFVNVALDALPYPDEEV